MVLKDWEKSPNGVYWLKKYRFNGITSVWVDRAFYPRGNQQYAVWCKYYGSMPEGEEISFHRTEKGAEKALMQLLHRR